jgi:exopolyphosphatase/guanosine-5'-triphosphate,3'-diphosphate pyrophosphatase
VRGTAKVGGRSAKLVDREQFEALEELAARHNYGLGPEHPKHVLKLSLKIFEQFVALGLLPESASDRLIISAAALLHNLALPSEPHNKVAFDLLAAEAPAELKDAPLSVLDFSAVLYCVLWHRGSKFKKRGAVKVVDRPHLEKLAAIIRVADALDRSQEQLVNNIRVELDGEALVFRLKSPADVGEEAARAEEKADLMKKAFALDQIVFLLPRHAKHVF